MTRKVLFSFVILMLAGGIVRLPATQNSWTPPRTPDGQPDLQGIWTSSTLTPLERPAEFAGKEFLTEAEVAEYEKRLASENSRDRRDGSAEVDVGRAYNEFWFERGKVVGTRRTSLIVDPPDGRIPALTPAAQQRKNALAAYRAAHPADGPEDLPLNVRCIAWGAGPPMLPSGYNNNYQIVQNRDYVVVFVEMIHDARIIPLDGRPHLPQHIRQWMGDPRGHWEGNTLVVETTNFTDKSNFQVPLSFSALDVASENLKVTERFTRAGPDTLLYEFTVDDPSSFTRPWSAQIPMGKSEGLFEYACHEGNYALGGLLRGARVEENKEVK